MPRLKDNAVPKYREHKQSGQAIVTLDGHDFLLGRYGSKASRAEYRRLTGEWQQNGRKLWTVATNRVFTVIELIAAYLDFAGG